MPVFVGSCASRSHHCAMMGSCNACYLCDTRRRRMHAPERQALLYGACVLGQIVAASTPACRICALSAAHSERGAAARRHKRTTVSAGYLWGSPVFNVVRGLQRDSPFSIFQLDPHSTTAAGKRHGSPGSPGTLSRNRTPTPRSLKLVIARIPRMTRRALKAAKQRRPLARNFAGYTAIDKA
jgi:hypothetical protein